MSVTQAKLTLEEFLKLPGEEPALEFEDGVVSQKASPKGKHSTLQLRLAERINQSTASTRRAMAFPELRTNFAGRSYVPDISVFPWDRIPLDANGDVDDDFVGPPDLAVELVSPEQSVNRLVRRCLWYVENGVRVALVVDPADRSVLLFRLEARPQALHGESRIDLDDILPELQLTVAELFALLRIG